MGQQAQLPGELQTRRWVGINEKTEKRKSVPEIDAKEYDNTPIIAAMTASSRVNVATR